MISFVTNSSLERELFVILKNFIITNIIRIQFILSRFLIQVLENVVVIIKNYNIKGSHFTLYEARIALREVMDIFSAVNGIRKIQYIKSSTAKVYQYLKKLDKNL